MVYEKGHLDETQSYWLAQVSGPEYELDPAKATEELERMMKHVRLCHSCAVNYIESLRKLINNSIAAGLLERILDEFDDDFED
jgi:hypothetical protein